MDLFEFGAQENDPSRPLAERLRPQATQDFVGLKSDTTGWRLIRRALGGEPLSTNLIFWGPPGTGKTSLARLIAKASKSEFHPVNAVDTGAKELRQIGERAKISRMSTQAPPILFIDEIHRLNKSQQDVLLPYSERGDFVLIGATTENPSYELISALLSRCQVVCFDRHNHDQLQVLLDRAAKVENIKLAEVFSDAAQAMLIDASDGDARRLLTQFATIAAEFRSGTNSFPLSPQHLKELLNRPSFGYQSTGEDHYDCISAFIKSVRGSDPDASVYYLARMLEAGEDPVFIARRLVILASEDIGNADPRGLGVAVSGLQAVELVGLPEAAISLAQVTTYLASAPKSNASYMALKKAQQVVQATGRPPVPLALRSSRTALSKDLGYGKDYLYSHDSDKGFIAQNFLPESLRGQQFYAPKELGFEKTIRQYLAWLKGHPPSD